MPIEVRVPKVGESINEVRLGDWLKSEGDAVAADETLIELESEKATFDIPAPSAGIVSKLLKQAGETAAIGDLIAVIDDSAGAKAQAGKPAEKKAEAPAAKPAPQTPSEAKVMPAAARAMAERGLSPEKVTPSGPGGRILKEDVQRVGSVPAPAPAAVPAKKESRDVAVVKPSTPSRVPSGDRSDEVVPMTLLRRRIAERLVHAQSTAALLTTFNEVDMTAIMELRNKYKDSFQERYGVKLGFMSFFVKAAVDALIAFPAVNAEIRGTDIVYHHYCDIGVAIGGGKGLVVPVLRHCERMSFGEIEQQIMAFAQKAKENKISPDDLTGGTFTISNGGVYGSMLSTPIVNPPQSGVLGMHNIQDRVVARNGQVVIRPMMYLALTYDHRIVDGREGVSFLKRVKESIEDPGRLLLEL